LTIFGSSPEEEGEKKSKAFKGTEGGKGKGGKGGRFAPIPSIRIGGEGGEKKKKNMKTSIASLFRQDKQEEGGEKKSARLLCPKEGERSNATKKKETRQVLSVPWGRQVRKKKGQVVIHQGGGVGKKRDTSRVSSSLTKIGGGGKKKGEKMSCFSPWKQGGREKGGKKNLILLYSHLDQQKLPLCPEEEEKGKKKPGRCGSPFLIPALGERGERGKAR